MLKESIIVIIVIILIISYSYIIQKYLVSSSNELIENLEKLKEIGMQNLENNNIEEFNTKIDEISEKWDEIKESWSYIVTHEELDLIELSLLEIKGGANTNNIKFAIKEIDAAMFLLGHIPEKQKLQLKNIF